MAGKVFNFFRKILQYFKENLPIYTEKFNGFHGKMWRLLQKNLTAFIGTFNDFGFHVKTVKFSWKSWKLFLRFYDIVKEICWFLHENLTVFTGKSKSSEVPKKIITFSSKNRLIFPYKSADFL